MLTQKDINKLKKVFVTKKDLKNELKRFATKEDLEITKSGIHTMFDNAIKELMEFLGPSLKKIDDIYDEIRGHRVAIGDHEERIEKLEDKVFAT